MRQIVILVLLVTVAVAAAALEPPTGPQAGPVSKIYWTVNVFTFPPSSTSSIFRANVDGSAIEQVVTGLRGPQYIALDVAADKMYWTETGGQAIKRANLDGTGVEELVTGVGLAFQPEGIALDVGGGKMYWANAFGKIQRANLEIPSGDTPSTRTDVEDVVDTTVDPRGIALDLSGAKIYWTSTTAGKIQRANLDGTNIQDLVTTGPGTDPASIALDVNAGKMYWTEFTVAKVRRANLDGTDIDDLVTADIIQPFGIALDVSNAKMYWTHDTVSGQKIRCASLVGSGVQDVLTGIGFRVRGLALDLGVEDACAPKQPDPGDTDGDGCSDLRENGPVAMQGGLRDYLNPWDFFDVNGDKNIDVPFDILPVVLAYQQGPNDPGGPGPNYTAAKDRGPPVAGALYAWQRTGPDGSIDVVNDVLPIILQYLHSCK